MAIAKSYMKLIREADGKYTATPSKEQTTYAMFVVDGWLDANANGGTLYCGADEVIAFKAILTRYLVNNPKNIQPTPIFYFSESKTLGINVASYVSSIDSGCGLGSLCSMQPVVLSEVAPFDGAPKLGKLIINSKDVFLFTAAQNQFVKNIHMVGMISYSPQEDLALQTSNKTAFLGKDDREFLCHVTPNGVVKTVTGYRNELSFLNGGGRQSDNSSTQVSLFYLTTTGTSNIRYPETKALVDSFFMGGERGLAASYLNYYVQTSPDVHIKTAIVLPSTGTTPAKRAFGFTGAFIESEASAHAVIAVDTNKRLGSFYVTPTFLGKEERSGNYYQGASFMVTHPKSIPIADPLEFSGIGYAYTLAYSLLGTIFSSSYPTTLHSYKARMRFGHIACIDGNGAHTYDGDYRIKGKVVYILDDKGVPYFATSLNQMLLFIWPIHYAAAPPVFFIVRVTYEDDTIDSTPLLSALFNPGDPHPLNLYGIENGTKLKKLDFTTIPIADCPITAIPFNKVNQGIMTDPYLFPNASNKKIKKVMAYATNGIAEIERVEIFTIIDSFSA